MLILKTRNSKLLKIKVDPYVRADAIEYMHTLTLINISFLTF
jgi:hypothetical protein